MFIILESCKNLQTAQFSIEPVFCVENYDIWALLFLVEQARHP